MKFTWFLYKRGSHHVFIGLLRFRTHRIQEATAHGAESESRT